MGEEGLESPVRIVIEDEANSVAHSISFLRLFAGAKSSGYVTRDKKRNESYTKQNVRET